MPIVKIRVLTFALFAAIIPALPAAGDTDVSAMKISGYWNIQTGQFVDYYLLNSSVSRQWLLRSFLNLGAAGHPTNRLEVHANAEIKMWYNTYAKQYIDWEAQWDIPVQYFNVYIDRMEAAYSFGDIEKPFLTIGFGYFPFKYNPDVKDLGEYLFRSGAYPAWLINDFDFPKARVAGLRLSSILFNSLHQDLLLTGETDMPPFWDLNAAWIGDYDLLAAKTFHIGLGAMYRSLMPVDNKLTTPKVFQNEYLTNVDTLADSTVQGDTGHYTFSGAKIMARFSLDPKRVFMRNGDFGIFGDEDCKLYGEAAILGVVPYPSSTANPYGYDTLLQKMPIMLGFNVPAFKVLDALSVEVEYYQCPYANSFQTQARFLYPLPDQGTLGSLNYRTGDNVRWSVYARRSLKNGLVFVAQVARDHVRNESFFKQGIDREQALRDNRGLMWMVKAGYCF